MTDAPEIITSRRGGKKLLHKGFIYHRRDSRKGNTYWACAKKGECKATAVSRFNDGAVEVVKEKEHVHAPNREEVEAERVVTSLKRIASDHPELPPAQILRTELPKCSEGVLSQLPERENLKKTMRRERARDQPSNPMSLSELREIPDRYQSTLGGEQFVIYDSFEEDDAEDENRVIVFSTKRNLELLFKCAQWFVDGTFKTAPHIFVQIFTILGLVVRSGVDAEDPNTAVALPLVYALLPDKTQQNYITVLEKVKEAALRFRIRVTTPSKIMSDFEMAIINAVREVFPNALIRLCFFHLGQSCYRKVQKAGLQDLYNDPDDRSVKNAVHSLLGLAFLPHDTVIAAFVELERASPQAVGPVFRYFDETYLRGPRGRGARRRPVEPRYELVLWNTHEATLADEHMTNNISEGWHNRFQLVIGKKHPSLYACLTELQKEHGDTETILMEMRLGRKIKNAPKKKWMDLQRRIRNIVQDLPTYANVVDFLGTIGHHFQL